MWIALHLCYRNVKNSFVSNTTLFIMFCMERQVDLGYRNSYRRTVAAALLASLLAVMAAMALLITPSAVFPLRLAAELLSLLCLAICGGRATSPLQGAAPLR